MDPLDIWRVWKDVPQWVTLGKETIKVAVLTDVDRQVDALATEYAKAKIAPQWIGRASVDEIRASVDKLRDYLIGLSSPNLGRFPTKSTTIDNLSKFAQATWARNELIKIYSLQDDGKLPPDPVPWSRRRSVFVKMRNAVIQLGFQMESAMRQIDREIAEAEGAEESIRGVGHDPFITQEELTMLEQDWKDWIKTEQEARDWRRVFQNVARASRDAAEAYSKIIDAGDRANRP